MDSQSDYTKIPKVTVVIPVWNALKWLPGCLACLRQQTFTDFKIIMVDNGSTDGSREFVTQHAPEVEIVAFPNNRGFPIAVNAGIRHSNSEYVALLNADTLPRATWLAQLVKSMARSPADVGSVTSKMLLIQNPMLIDDAGDILSWYGSARKRGHLQIHTRYTKREAVFSACAGAALYRRSFFEAVGLFDETFTIYLEDVDLGLRGQLYGFRCLYEPKAEILHHGHSAGVVGGRYAMLMTRNRLLLFLKNMPGPLLRKYWWPLLFGQLYFFLVYKKPSHCLRGYAHFLRSLPYGWRERQRIQPRRAISLAQLEGLLSTELGEPPLREIIRGWFRR